MIPIITNITLSVITRVTNRIIIKTNNYSI